MIRVLIISLVLLGLCGCTASRDIQINSNPISVPLSLLTPLQHPVATGYPHTVNTLLITINQYEALVDRANNRFEEIIYIQENTVND